jgi:hypothetical protein
MVTDAQVRRLMKLIHSEKTLAVAATKAGMDEKTARKWRDADQLPSQVKTEHTWRTRPDPFEDVWPELKAFLKTDPGLEAKELFEYLQRQEPGRFADGQLRTLQRRVKVWRALEGPAKEVYFPQVHEPGQLCQSDFTDMTPLGVTLQGQPFDHLVYHFVLTYSNWETASICFSESFEALSGGFQGAAWELGGVPQAHQTDCLSAAVQKLDHPEDFTARYAALMRHYGLEARKTNPSSPHENGDIEQRHYRFYRVVDQRLMLRGSRDFASRQKYDAFLRKILSQLNAGRQDRLAEELAVLRRLPARRLDDFTRLEVRVSRFSTIRVSHNTYSVDSRLRDERVQVRLYADHLDVFYAQRHLERIPRLRGKGGHYIQYRHIIDVLVRKPGAFAHYQYRDDLFPTTLFRVAYDALCAAHSEAAATRQYLAILQLAARESEAQVEAILRGLLDTQEPLSAERVEELLEAGPPSYACAVSVRVEPVDLRCYDRLLPSLQWNQAVAP